VKICKKIMVMLIMLCLFINMIPAAMAVDTEVRLSAPTDYSELKKQVAIANELNSYDYTADSWKVLQKALDKGKNILKGSHGQMVVNEATKAIEKGMDELVEMDYTQLDNALAEVYTKLEENIELYDIWYQLTVAIEDARPLLVSGQQGAVNNAAQKLRTLLEELDALSSTDGAVEVVYEEVEVEVLPTGDYCNIPMHRTWPVLFIVSAVLNVALIVLLAYVILKKRQTIDNTPLVSYDIDDDMDY